MKSVRNHTVAALSLTLLFGAGLAVADDVKRERAGQRNQQQDVERKAKPILAGPRVEDEARAEAAVTRMGEQQRQARGPQVPPMMWLRMVRSLDLTEAQSEQVDAFVEKQRKAMLKFQEEHGEALRAIRTEMREARQAEDRERMQELMVKAREMRSKAPQPERVQGAIWKVLTAEQQETLRENIAQFQREREERMRERQRRIRGERSPDVMTDENEDAMSDRPQRRRPAIGDRPGRQRGEAVRDRRGAGADDDRRPARGERPGAPQLERQRRQRPQPE